MNTRIKKKHRVYGKIYLKQYRRHDQSLPFTWFELCKKIRNDIGHPIGRKLKSLERHFRRKYYWTENQHNKLWECASFNYDINNYDITNTPYKLYNAMVNDITSLQEKYEDVVILDYLEEKYGG